MSSLKVTPVNPWALYVPPGSSSLPGSLLNIGTEPEGLLCHVVTLLGYFLLPVELELNIKRVKCQNEGSWFSSHLSSHQCRICRMQ